MTQPTPPTGDRFVRDVARAVDRRRMRRRLLMWVALLIAVAMAALYLRCGGFGLGGAGPGAGGAAGSARPLVGPARCAVRLTATGLTVDGKPASRDDVVAVCKATTGADVVITGDARHGDGEQLKAALQAAGISVHEALPGGSAHTPRP